MQPQQPGSKWHDGSEHRGGFISSSSEARRQRPTIETAHMTCEEVAMTAAAAAAITSSVEPDGRCFAEKNAAGHPVTADGYYDPPAVGSSKQCYCPSVRRLRPSVLPVPCPIAHSSTRCISEPRLLQNTIRKPYHAESSRTHAQRGRILYGRRKQPKRQRSRHRRRFWTSEAFARRLRHRYAPVQWTAICVGVSLRDTWYRGDTGERLSQIAVGDVILSARLTEKWRQIARTTTTLFVRQFAADWPYTLFPSLCDHVSPR